MTPSRDNPESGSVLLSVLIVATIAVLLGFGRLALFRNQVARRVNRSTRLRETSATQSALAWLHDFNDAGRLPAETNAFSFPSNGWPADFLVAPAPRVFPSRPADFERILAEATSWRDANGIEQSVLALGDGEGKVGDKVTRAFDIRLGDADGVLWDAPLHGRRYFALFADIFSPSPGVGDIVRLGLTPLGKPLPADAAGATGAVPAIWLEQRPDEGGAAVRVLRREGSAETVVLTAPRRPPGTSKGLQLVGGRLALVEAMPTESGGIHGLHAAHEVAAASLPSAFATDFLAACRNAGGMRLTLQVVIHADRTKLTPEQRKQAVNRFWGVTISPSYEYEIAVRRPRADGATLEVATPVAVDPVPGPDGRLRVTSLDAHGFPHAPVR